MRYKLINKQTGEEHLCDKVTIDGCDYYFTNEPIKTGDSGWLFENQHIKSICKFDCSKGTDGLRRTDKKVIATNNPDIDIPKVVDEVFEKAWKIAEQTGIKDEHQLMYLATAWHDGHSTSKETHPFSEEDMVNFAEFVAGYTDKNRNYLGQMLHARSKYDGAERTVDLLQIWKEQQPKIVYYE